MAHVVAPTALETDECGTFYGEIPRINTPLGAARARTRLVVDATGSPRALAYEASFSNGFGFVEHCDFLMCADHDRDLKLVEDAVRISVLPPRRVFTTIEDSRRYAHYAGFPAQESLGRADNRTHKEFRIHTAPDRAACAALSKGFAVSYEPDFRAHRCPSRAEAIADRATTMAKRLNTSRPPCDTPSFGRVDVERGVLAATAEDQQTSSPPQSSEGSSVIASRQASADVCQRPAGRGAARALRSATTASNPAANVSIAAKLTTPGQPYPPK